MDETATKRVRRQVKAGASEAPATPAEAPITDLLARSPEVSTEPTDVRLTDDPAKPREPKSVTETPFGAVCHDF